ncbi:hypothetical protein ACTHO5_20095 [Cytobacillus praedii]
MLESYDFVKRNGRRRTKSNSLNVMIHSLQTMSNIQLPSKTPLRCSPKIWGVMVGEGAIWFAAEPGDKYTELVLSIRCLDHKNIAVIRCPWRHESQDSLRNKFGFLFY